MLHRAGFVLSVHPMVRLYSKVDYCIHGDIREAIERLVKELHITPNPNGKTHVIKMEDVVDCFWTEFEGFRNFGGVFYRLERFRGR